VGHHAGRQASCAALRLCLALLERGQLHKRVLLAQQKVSPGERQRLADARAGISQRGEQHLAAQVWHEVEQGADLRRQQVLRKVVDQRGRVVNGHRQVCGRCGVPVRDEAGHIANVVAMFMTPLTDSEHFPRKALSGCGGRHEFDGVYATAATVSLPPN